MSAVAFELDDKKIEAIVRRIDSGEISLLASGILHGEDVHVRLSLDLDNEPGILHMGTLTVPVTEYPLVAALLHTGAANLRVPFLYDLTVGGETYEEDNDPRKDQPQ